MGTQAPRCALTWAPAGAHGLRGSEASDLSRRGRQGSRLFIASRVEFLLCPHGFTDDLFSYAPLVGYGVDQEEASALELRPLASRSTGILSLCVSRTSMRKRLPVFVMAMLTFRPEVRHTRPCVMALVINSLAMSTMSPTKPFVAGIPQERRKARQLPARKGYSLRCGGILMLCERFGHERQPPTGTAKRTGRRPD